MEAFFLICACLGGTLILCQTLMSLLGLGDHHDAADGHDVHFDHGGDGHGDHGEQAHGEHGSSWFAGILTFRAIVAAVTFFGLAGMAASNQWGSTEPVTFGVALAAAGAALFLVAGMMRAMSQLRAEGTVHMHRALGQVGTVYLKIPGHKSGVGKIQVQVQNRTVECQAVTAQDELPTGARAVVVAIVNNNTVEVAPVPPSENPVHA